jgi:hypothetical protein
MLLIQVGCRQRLQTPSSDSSEHGVFNRSRRIALALQVPTGRQPVQWRRDNLEAWRAAHSDWRREADRQWLAGVFNLAAQIPIVKDALDWAREHDIEFIVDRTTTVGGYYHPGSGVVALGSRFFFEPRRVVSYLVHEIRHAWQDYHHLVPTGGTSFAGYFIREALIEADATAHEDMASRQYALAMNIFFLKKKIAEGAPEPKPDYYKIKLAECEKALDASTSDAVAYWKSFSYWFASPRARKYGTAAVKRFARALDVPDVELEEFNFEYTPYETQDGPREEGVDASAMADLRRLGKTFDNLNYFNADKDKSLTLKFIVPSAAQRFYTEERTSELAEEVRRRWLLAKHEQGREVTIYPN